MTRLFAKIAGVILLCALFAPPAAAQPYCLPGSIDRDSLVANLAQHFNEYPVARGLLDGGVGLIERTADEDDRSFSLIVVMPDGRACLLATGVGWENVPHPPAGEKM